MSGPYQKDDPVPEVLDLHYVPKLDLWRLVNRDVYGAIQLVHESTDSAEMTRTVRKSLDLNPHLQESLERSSVRMEHHVCARLWVSVEL